MRKNDRVVLVASGEHGEIVQKIPKADGIWAEQYFEVSLDDNDLFDVTVGEHALVLESEYPDWDEQEVLDAAEAAARGE